MAALVALAAFAAAAAPAEALAAARALAAAKQAVGKARPQEGWAVAWATEHWAEHLACRPPRRNGD